MHAHSKTKTYRAKYRLCFVRILKDKCNLLPGDIDLPFSFGIECTQFAARYLKIMFFGAEFYLKFETTLA